MNQAVPSVSGMKEASRFAEAFSSEQGLLGLLVAVRGSSLEPEEKMSIRDDVLEYSSVSDPIKKEEIKKKVVTFLNEHSESLGINVGTESETNVPESVESSPTSENVRSNNSLTRSRPKPIFTPPSIGTTESSNVPEAVNQKQTAVESPISKEVPAETLINQDATVTKDEPAVADMSTVAPETASVSESDSGPQERIKAIKHEINSKLGNPINLIDMDEAVGREYMTAMLDAMKKSSVGGASLDEALVRLENAFEQAKIVLAKQSEVENKEVASAPKAEPTETSSASASKEVATEESPMSQAVNSKVDTTLTPATSAGSSIPTSETQKPSTPETVVNSSEQTTTSVPLATIPVENNKLVPETKIEQPQTSQMHNGLFFGADTQEPSSEEESNNKVEDEINSDVPKKTPSEPEEKDIHEVKITDSTKSSIPTEAGESAPLSPVGDDNSLSKKIADLKETSKEQEKAMSEPLSDIESPQVTEGLTELLSEWKIFKSSGFFGIGPSGIEHPLYKQLSGLPMAAVVSGRFDGVTPAIKQNITDYMNGWRYEHGLMHDMGETFEHYLRRVILHILNKQRQNKPN